MFFVFPLILAILTGNLYAFDVLKEELPFVVVIPSYNNSEWVEANLQSIFMQKYSNYRVIYINDSSTDETSEKVENIALKHISENDLLFNSIAFTGDCSPRSIDTFAVTEKNSSNSQPFFTLVNNEKRCGSLCNIYRAITSCLDKEIIVLVDGDDWLFDETILNKLNEAYQSNHIWLTHGNLIEYPHGGATWCEPVPEELIATNAFRGFKCPSHLRTFYTWLFKKINLEDLTHNGDFFAMTGDQAIMFPMIEMAGERHLFISDVLYVYNMKNPINDNKVNPQQQRDLESQIRALPPYSRLNEDQINSSMPQLNLDH